MQDKITKFWDKKPCGSQTSVFILPIAYFQETEDYRYRMMPFIKGFAQFEKYRGKMVLEIGIGIGCDFAQWVKNGALAYGIDASSESVELTRKRLKAYNLRVVDIQVADAQQLPYKDNLFDAVYSWGVLHHVPDTKGAISEAIRVCKVGGEIKLMLYNRSSIHVYLFWIYNNLRGNFPKSLKRSFYEDFESIGTKVFTQKEIVAMLPKNVVVEKMWCPISGYELMLDKSKFLQFFAKIFYGIVGKQSGFFRLIVLRKTK